MLSGKAISARAETLEDRFGRRIDYLRLSVTDRCDPRCRYCLPRGFRGYEEPQHWLTFDEIERIVDVFAALGVRRVRLTGGEPLTRRDLPLLAARLARLAGVQDLSLSTNATQLARQAHALRQAGIARLNVSLDSLRPERFHHITGRDALDQVLAGLVEAGRAGFTQIKINMVVLNGVNDDEVDDMAAFCMQHGFVLRLIEPMPVGEAGRSVPPADLQPIRQRLQRTFGLLDGVIAGGSFRLPASRGTDTSMYGGGPARYLTSPDGRFSVGFITPMSQHFCASCNRVRLSVDGVLYLCLGQDDRLELRPLLRSGATREALTEAILAAVERKPGRHEFQEAPVRILRPMAQTGG